jgi:hypothetical protein
VFNPSKEDVRRFFCEAWHKHRQGSLLTALETLAVDWILQHPEYQDELSDTGAAVTRDYGVEDGRTNPFLHLSMHLAIAEQLSTNQPPGICSAFRRLVERRGGEHEAAHDVMDCLGAVVWTAQRAGTPLPPDDLSARYLECLERRATLD